MKQSIIFFAMIYCTACNENEANPGKEISATDTTVHSDSAVTSTSDLDTYAIRLSDSVTLSLQQWDSTIDLHGHLGKPLKQKTRQLDRNSDTFSGSFIKDVEYDGLKLQLFSPPQNGRTFWIQEMIITSNKYKTARGITLGDEWQKVKQSYPSIRKFPGENENMYYVADDGYEKSIEMEFQNEKLKKLRIYYTLN